MILYTQTSLANTKFATQALRFYSEILTDKKANIIMWFSTSGENSDSGPFFLFFFVFFCVCIDLIACCSISDFPGFVARQLDEPRSIFLELRPNLRLFEREIFQTHIIFYV